MKRIELFFTAILIFMSSVVLLGCILMVAYNPSKTYEALMLAVLAATLLGYMIAELVQSFKSH